MTLTETITQLIQDNIDHVSELLLPLNENDRRTPRQRLKALIVVQTLLSSKQTAALNLEMTELLGANITPKQIIADLIVERLDFEACHSEVSD